MLLNYNHVFYFHVAAVEGSVAGAALRLGVRQPTVSEQIRVLERALGTELFERTQSGLRLTEAGRLAFVHTARMFRAGEQIGPSKATPTRTLRIGVSDGIARSTMIDLALPLLLAGDCVPTLRGADSVELLRELRGGLLDLVLSEIEPSEDMRRGLTMELVSHTRLVAIASPDLVPSADWSNVRLATYRPTSPYRWEIASYLEQRGLAPTIVVEAEDALFLVEAAVARSCMAIVPSSAATAALASGSVRELARIESPSLAIHALYLDNTTARSAVALLVGASTS